MPQTGPDLVSAGYPSSNPTAALLGGTTQATQTNLPARSNMYWLSAGTLTDGALAASGVAASVAVPVVPGDVISKIDIVVGATAASTPTHGFAALYSGIAVPALLAQSTDSLTAAVAASAIFTYTLASPVTVTSVNAPNGYLYVSIVGVGTAVQSAAAVATPTAVGYQWYSTGPLFLSATHGSGLTGTAPATIVSPAAKAVAPVVVLR